MRFQSLRCGADVFPRRVLCGPPGGKSRYNGYFRNLLKHIKIARAYVGIEKKKFLLLLPKFPPVFTYMACVCLISLRQIITTCTE